MIHCMEKTQDILEILKSGSSPKERSNRSMNICRVLKNDCKICQIKEGQGEWKTPHAEKVTRKKEESENRRIYVGSPTKIGNKNSSLALFSSMLRA